MIINNNDKISSFKCFVLFVSVMIGVGIMFMPSEVAKYAEQNGWIVVLLGGVISFLVFVLLFKITMSNPDVTFIELLNSTFGKVLGIVFSFIYVIYFIIFSSI